MKDPAGNLGRVVSFAICRAGACHKPVQELPTAYKLVLPYCLPLTQSAGTCPRPTEVVSFIVGCACAQDKENRQSMTAYLADLRLILSE